MKPATRDRLLTLNRQFYASVADPFHSTRRSWPRGNLALLDAIPATGTSTRPLNVLDAGCGNGRFAAMLSSLALPICYTGVDANARLIEFAHRLTKDLQHVMARFVKADLSRHDWPTRLGSSPQHFDMIVCLSTLQHMPGRELRASVMRSLSTLLAPEGCLAVSAWQFLTSPRLVARQLPWAEAGVDEADTDPGDALLPWKQETYAIRYVHQIDIGEMQELADDAGLMIRQTYLADGKEDNLNLYAVMAHAHSRSG